MSENETQSTEEKVVEAEASSAAPEEKQSKVKGYVMAVVLAAVIILGALYLLEKEGRSSTNIFGSLIASQEAKAPVAVVNGEKIKNSELTVGVQQFTQAAIAQGVDVSSPDIQTEIKTQALDVLINTRLLKQNAIEKGFTVSDEDAQERLTTIEAEVGGPEVLAQRMEELGIDDEKLLLDVKDELLIQQLLDSIFAEANTEVTEEEIAEFYQNAGGTEAGLPALEEVRDQVVLQIKTSKEQVAIDEYINELKGKAQIDLK